MTTPTPKHSTSNPLSSKDLAEKLDTDARTLRVFLRSIAFPKAGKHYAFTSKDVASLSKKFKAWEDERYGDQPAHEEDAPDAK